MCPQRVLTMYCNCHGNYCQPGIHTGHKTFQHCQNMDKQTSHSLAVPVLPCDLLLTSLHCTSLTNKERNTVLHLIQLKIKKATVWLQCNFTPTSWNIKHLCKSLYNMCIVELHYNTFLRFLVVWLGLFPFPRSGTEIHHQLHEPQHRCG